MLQLSCLINPTSLVSVQVLNWKKKTRKNKTVSLFSTVTRPLNTSQSTEMVRTGRDRKSCPRYAKNNSHPEWSLLSSDIDECENEALFNCTKDSTCVNLEGNYTCDCNPGYTQDDDLCIGRTKVTCDDRISINNNSHIHEFDLKVIIPPPPFFPP